MICRMEDNNFLSSVMHTQQTKVDEQELIEYLKRNQRRPVPGSGWRKRLGEIVPYWMRPYLRLYGTRLVSFYQQAKAKQLADQSPLRLNLGCGELPQEGYINIDLIGLPVDVAWDLNRPLPFTSGSVDVIFHEHVLEHLAPLQGYFLLKECHRLLKEGGVLRIVVPDAGRYMASYFDEHHTFLHEWRDMQFTPMIELQYEFYSFGHKAVYDYETAALFCHTIGFAQVERKEFEESRINPCPDSDWRIMDSFYLEAVK